MMSRWAVGLCAGLLWVGCGPGKPEAPSWSDKNPAVANDNKPLLRAFAASDRTLQVFTEPDCQGRPILQVNVNGQGVADFELSVEDDTTTTLSLWVVEGGSAVSKCSKPFVYTEDSRAPEAPQWAEDNPVQSNRTKPTLRATAEPGSRVTVHASTDCTGPELASASANASGAVSLEVPVVADSTNRLSLRTRDAAGNLSTCSDVFTLEHEDTPPADVALLGFTPESPANHNAPVLSGTSEPGTRVELFSGSFCSPPALLTLPVDEAGHFEATLSVKDDTSSYFSARAVDAAGNTSSCKSTSSYQEDSTPPSAPWELRSTSSPNSSTTISVTGGAQSGARVLVFTREGCTGAPVASTTVAAYYSTFTVSVPVSENTATSLYVATQDAAGNRSKCVGPLVYVHDSVPPELEGVKVSDGPGEDLRHQLVANVAEAHWEGFTDAHGIVLYEHFLTTSSTCSGSSSGLPAPRTTTQASARLTGLSLADKRTYFHCVRAKDGAGNWSPYVASDGFRVDLSPPVVSATTPRMDMVETEVDVLGPVLFTFNEPMDVSSVTPDSFTLEVNGTRVATTVACDATATSCAFRPVSPLPYRETVHATLAATVKDAAGRVMTSPVSLSFTTRGRVWQAPREVRTARPGLFPDVAVDGQGHALAVWVQGTASGAYRPFASRSTPYGGWEPALELDTVHPGDVERPAVAVNEAGFGVAVWESHDGTRVDLYAAEYTPGTGWGAARLLETRDEPVSTPRVGVDAQGNALVVWRQSDGTAESLWAARLAAGSGWSAPLLLETEAGATTVPALALEGSGRAVAAWLQPDVGGTVRVRASRFVPGSGWTPAEQAAATGEGTSVSAALSANGSAFLLFRGTDASLGASLYTTRFVPGEGWSAVATRLGELLPGGDDPGVAMDRWGRAMAVWTQPGGGTGTWYLSVARFTAEEGWRPVSLTTQMASQPSVASDGQGNFHIVWVENTSGSDQVFAARYPEGATAISSSLAIEPFHGGTSKRPRVRANGAGAAMTVWYRDNGGGFSSNLVYAASFE